MGSKDRNGLSARGARLVAAPPAAEYIRENGMRAADRWDADTNPDGYIALCTAENALMADELIAAMNRVEVPAGVLAYDSMVGSEWFRERLGSFMGRTFLGRSFPVEQIAVLAGAGSVLEALFYAIAEPGDGVLVPTPGYSGFWADLETRDGLKIIPVHRSPKDGYRLTPDMLDAAIREADRPVKAMLFTSPDNPMGLVFTPDEVAGMASWAEDRGLHVVFDEIYALSVFGSVPFVSVASQRPSLGEKVHVVWAFSKDFGASGLRCGVLVSENPGVLAAVEAQAYWAAASGDTQYRLGALVGDAAWVDEYLAENRNRLRTAYAAATTALTEVGIPYVAAQSGMFVLCDLRGFLTEQTWEAEYALWRSILDGVNVNVTPGSACRIEEPGWVRLCYARVSNAAVREGVAKIGDVLGG